MSVGTGPGILTDKSGIRTDEKVRFVLSFVDSSRQMRDEFTEMLQENLSNYLVQPFSTSAYNTRTDFPLATTGQSRRQTGYSLLKDSQSHEVVELLLAKLWGALFGVPGYIKSRRVGMEDTFRASTVTRLLDYSLDRKGHTLAMYLGLKDALWAGTGVIQQDWWFREEPVEMRSIEPVILPSGEIIEDSRVFTAMKVLEDDARIKHVGILDFYPDPGEVDTEFMLGAAKRFKTTARKARTNPQFNRQAVEKAIRAGNTKHSADMMDDDWAEGVDRPQHRQHHPDFGPLVGFEYWGEVPWKPADGQRWRVLTVIGDQLVRERPWPLPRKRIPFYDWKITPMSDRFYGLSPLEISRHDQDLADVLKMMIADAVVKMTHPPHIVNRFADVDLAKLRRFHPNVPIMANSVDAIRTAEYRPDVASASAIFERSKASIKERTGALGILAGQGLGVDRASATEAQVTFQTAQDRPEMLAILFEREYLPRIANGIVDLYRRFLDDSGALADRVGFSPTPVLLSELMQDHDLKFVGSRLMHNKVSKLQAMERTAAVVGATPFAAVFPWDSFLREWLKESDLHELEAEVGVPEIVQRQIALAQQVQGGNSNGNQEIPRQAPSGLLPAQTSGGTLG